MRNLDTLEECVLEGLSDCLPLFGSTLLEPQLDLGGDRILHQVPHACGDDLCHLGNELETGSSPGTDGPRLIRTDKNGFRSTLK